MKHLFAFMFLFLFCGVAVAQKPPAPPGGPASSARLPDPLKKVAVDQNLGKKLPGDLVFRDENGSPTTVAALLHPGRPVLLAPVYFKCPGLCNYTLNDLLSAMRVMKGTAGVDYDVWAVSFEPDEGPDLAREKKKGYLAAYKRGRPDGLRFLTGDAANVKRFVDAIGFHATKDAGSGQWAHAACVLVLTPEGVISRYFLGLDYRADDLSAALDTARIDAVGKPVVQTLLYCFHYDPSTGRYSLIVTRAINVAAVLTTLALAGGIGLLLWRERRTGRREVTA